MSDIFMVINLKNKVLKSIIGILLIHIITQIIMQSKKLGENNPLCLLSHLLLAWVG